MVIGDADLDKKFPRIKWGYAKDVPLDFDADHYATNGWRASQAAQDLEGTLREYPADLMLMLLGVNDMIWGHERPQSELIWSRVL
jgi:hypothetical protein